MTSHSPNGDKPSAAPESSTARSVPASAADLAEPLASVHTPDFPELLRELGGCLVLTTYQAGKLVVLRPDGDTINTHFSQFKRPMGMAVAGDRIAIGTHIEIVEFRDMPALAQRLSDPPRHDAVFVARGSHVTGAIDNHEMAWDSQGSLWFVNTLFSCLCTRDPDYSFVPRWRPPFVTQYAPEDRCHLNGLGMRDGRPRYVTALGESDTTQGWRANKRDGGVLIDMQADTVLARGLSMPHSPRWHDGRLWLLESGRGALVTINPHSGNKTEVARVPGFARGLDFIGPVAFVGLSQLRENEAFSGIDITDANPDRQSGVWAVHTGTGKTIGLLCFSGGVQEIFAVQALRGVLFPEFVHEGELLATTYALPDEALRDVAFSERKRE
jgi:uncharacterized protein (TIGR03032 family)